MTSRFAAPSLASLSVIMTRGGGICFFSSWRSIRWAASLGSWCVASALDQDIEHDAGLVHRPPQPMLHPGDLEHDLIQMPLVASPRKATTDLIGELPAEFARPRPHGFGAEDDAAGSEQLLHHAETKREAEIKP